MSNETSAVAPAGAQRAGVHRRHLVVLSAAQILSGLGNGAGLALGALLAAELGGSESLGGTVSVAISLGGMLAALPLARAAVAAGRRPALSVGYLIAFFGAVGMICAAALGSYPLLLLSGAAMGVGSATNLQARFAATDGAAPGRRARDLSLVVWALTIGAVLGPSLAGPGASLADRLSLPTNSGAFLFSAAGLALACLMIFAGLRPDPLKGTAAAAVARKPSLGQGLAALRGAAGAGIGVLAVSAGHACMVAVMSMTTIHLQHVHHGTGEASPDVLALIGLTLSGHIGGMYALSPLVGWCVDRWGHRASLLAAQGLFAASAVLCIAAPLNHPLVSVALFVLGLAWSFSSITGSAVVAERVPEENRVAAQGLTDSAMSAGGVLAGLGSGALLQFLGYQGLNAASLAVAVLMTVLILVRMPRR
ncbi:MAG: MFS transporter [Arthrobacter sp.]|nr:MFS transporter [Arthrobacter sp.]